VAGGSDEETLGAEGVERGGIDLQRGDTLDHFVVQDQIGAGAMGVVLLAVDPDLDRRVAIKLVLPHAGTPTEAAQVRMLREAQSMAKVTHPNVVTVHEVGFARGQLFIAMEFIDGRTLRKWSQEAKRSLAEVLEVYRAAGEGLAAAHAAGLVHRDFKPDNVLVGHDGRVVVTDFGLVSIAGAAADSGSLGTTGRQVVVIGDLSQTLTATGSALGTPAYMALEQVRGDPVDPRADQFAFCVSLWEALYGRRPFHRDSVAQTMLAASTGVPDPPPDPPAIRGSVPRSIRSVLERGLRAEPSQRWPDLRALLSQLRYDAGATRRRIAIASASIAGASLIAGAAWVFARSESAGPSCELGPTRAAEVWNAGTRERIAAAFAATGAGEGPAAELGARLDRWAERWGEAYREACEATHVRGEQSEARLDRRMLCLARNRDEVRTLVDALVETEDRAAAGQSAAAAAGSVLAVAQCEGESLEAWSADRIAPEHREEAAAVRGELDRALIEERLGHMDRALAMLEALVPRAEALGEDLVLAEVLTHAGKVTARAGRLDEAESLLRRAAEAAAEVGVPSAEAAAWMALADAVGTQRGDPKRAMGILAGAESAVRRAGERSVEADYERAMGGIMLLEQRFEEAETHLHASVELEQSTLDASGKDLGATYNALAGVYDALARPDEAMKAYELAHDNWREYYGESHPNVAVVLNNMGAQYRTMGKREDARAQHQAALEMLRSSVGDEHPWVAVAYEGLGILALEDGDLDKAREHQKMALAIRQAAYGPMHFTVASSLSNLAGLELMRGRAADAVEGWQQAREIFADAYGVGSVQVAETDVNLGRAQFFLGQLEGAEVSFAKGLVVLEQVFGPEHPGLVMSLSGLAEVRQMTGRCRDAAEPLGRAKALVAEHGMRGTLHEAGLLSIEGWCGLQAEDFTAALATFDRSIAIHTENPGEPYALARDLAGKTRALLGLRRRTEAREALAAARAKAIEAGDLGKTLVSELDALAAAIR
jgi:tetratricopeptide (TPR) repeat protein/predicted Ser/Thr protein kinase